MQPPIACTLGSEAAIRERMEDWRTFVRASVTNVDFAGGTTARFRLGGRDDELVAAVDLARREKRCCTFFDFRVEVGADVCWLVLQVPAQAAEVLADFVRGVCAAV